MAKHKCGDNGYRGGIVVEVEAGAGLIQQLVNKVLAEVQAHIQARAAATAVYNWPCPANCAKGKSGLVAYQTTSVTWIRKRIFVGANSKVVPGIQVRVVWRLLVQCKKDGGGVDPSPFELPWEDLEDLLAELYKVTDLDGLDTKLINVPQ